VNVRVRIAVLALIAVVSVVAFAVVRGEGQAPSTSGSPARTPSPTAAVAPPELTDAVTYRDHAFDPKLVPSPTASKSQSKLWYANGAWWGLLNEPESDGLHIYRLKPDGSSWIDTGTLVDERPSARADALAVGDGLYVVTAGPRARPEDAIRLSHFIFRDGLYRLDIDYPIVLKDSGVESVVIARDGTERLWIAYVFENRVWVHASDGDDHHWRPPFTPAVGGTAVAPDEIAAIVPFGDSIGLMWSNQREEAVYFSAHRNADPVDAWSSTEVVSRGLRQPDDHINMKADASGRVYAALKTSLDTLPNVNSLAPQILLVVRDRERHWRSHVVARVKDHHTRPIVLIDEGRDIVYVVATSPATGGSIYYKRSPLDDVSFETGLGTVLVDGGDGVRISNATSTKQLMTSEMDLVVLASDNSTARYFHAVLNIHATGVHAAPSPDPPVGDPQLAVNDSFDSWRDGEQLPAGWVGRDVETGEATVQARGDRGRVGQVASLSDGPPPRVCRGFAPIAAGRVLITFDIRARGTGRTEAVLALVRGAGGDAAYIRFGSRGTFTYVVGNARKATSARWKPDTWYKVSIELSLADRSTVFSIANAAGEAVLPRTRGAWPGPAKSVDEICFQPSAGAGKPSLEIDDLRVARVAPPD
jgi:hypothetical protein